MSGMPKPLKILLYAVAALASVLVLAALAVLVFVDPDDYRPRVEAAMSKAFGMTVTIEGKMGVRFIPLLNISLANVRVLNQGSELAFVKAGNIDIALLPLLVRATQEEPRGWRVGRLAHPRARQPLGRRRRGPTRQDVGREGAAWWRGSRSGREPHESDGTLHKPQPAPEPRTGPMRR